MNEWWWMNEESRLFQWLSEAMQNIKRMNKNEEIYKNTQYNIYCLSFVGAYTYGPRDLDSKPCVLHCFLSAIWSNFYSLRCAPSLIQSVLILFFGQGHNTFWEHPWSTNGFGPTTSQPRPVPTKLFFLMASPNYCFFQSPHQITCKKHTQTFFYLGLQILQWQNKHPASKPPSGEGTRNLLRPDFTSVDDTKSCPDSSSNFLFINVCNNCGLQSSHNSVEHHLFFTQQHLLFLIESQVSEATDNNLYSVSSNFIRIFSPKLNVE